MRNLVPIVWKLSGDNFDPLPHLNPRYRAEFVQNTRFAYEFLYSIILNRIFSKLLGLRTISRVNSRNFIDNCFITKHVFLNFETEYLHVVSDRQQRKKCTFSRQPIIFFSDFFLWWSTFENMKTYPFYSFYKRLLLGLFAYGKILLISGFRNFHKTLGVFK